MVYRGIIAGSTKFSSPFMIRDLYFHLVPAGAGFQVAPGTAMAVVFRRVEMERAVCGVTEMKQ